MHFVTGGHFNGKATWVRNLYGLAERDDFTWVSFYQTEIIDPVFECTKSNFYIIEGIESYIKSLIEMGLNQQQMIEQMKSLIADGLDWENAAKVRCFILIGTDISKGIVPMEKKNRDWRDITGWVYQDIAAKAEKVDVIWYGISRKLK
ncbi:bifunctional adenosylcobinamide kinase/adenosylcobinamide-phosphate guanylyltransferase [Bacillus sp. APMAM]|nr:bifunctional adenosylcobinamide kinase/adenosylcobinamide-phosphate guanylyltransferase [Bacillus sp. APMAM]RTZ53413.1 hypothetical protein EKO25_23440 [Bacillus sp. SAJ1]